jgi:hypothetical protein
MKTLEAGGLTSRPALFPIIFNLGQLRLFLVGLATILAVIIFWVHDHYKEVVYKPHMGSLRLVMVKN